MRAALVATLLLSSLGPSLAAEDWHARCAAAPIEKAIKPCEEALIDNPQDSLALKRLGDIYLGNHGEWHAIELYSLRMLIEPDNPEVFFDQAAAFATMWYFKEASPAMHRALELDPGNLQAQRLASIVFEQSGEAEAAFAAHLALALADIDTGMYDVARDYHYGRGTLADPSAARLWYVRAANAGHAAAMRVLGDILAYGELGVVDKDAADYWHQQAEAIRRSYEE